MREFIERAAVFSILVVLAVNFTACHKDNKGRAQGARTGTPEDDNAVYKHKGGKIDPYINFAIKASAGGPAGNSGSLTIPIGDFSSGNNSQSCFPTTDGWNKYEVLFYFLGPNVSPLPNPNNFPNSDNLSSVTISTCNQENGGTLETGIVIMDNLNPTLKVCNTNVPPPGCTSNSKLSRATMSTQTNHKYRATIFYKSGTVGALQNIKVDWSYP